MSVITADVIVLGLGAMGSAALWRLAQRGLRVIGIEQFAIGHALGSSHGETRIIRKAYFEHPDYVPLLLRTYELWNDLERLAGRQLYHETGLVIAGPPTGEAVPGARLAAGRHGLRLENLSPADRRRRFPWLELSDSLDCVFEPEAGFLEVEHCVESMVSAGEHAGGQVYSEQRVVRWSAQAGHVVVETEQQRFEAASLVIAGGPWSSRLVADAGIPLEVVRKPTGWYATGQGSRRPTCGFFVELPEGAFYGVPSTVDATTKVAEHSGGDPVHDPSALDRSWQPADESRIEWFLEHCLPGLGRETSRHSVCMYTLTPDRHFVIDRHPERDSVVLACGFSGHGFKFAPVVGEALADLAISGQTSLPIAFLRHRWPRAGQAATVR